MPYLNRWTDTKQLMVLSNILLFLTLGQNDEWWSATYFNDFCKRLSGFLLITTKFSNIGSSRFWFPVNMFDDHGPNTPFIPYHHRSQKNFVTVLASMLSILKFWNYKQDKRNKFIFCKCQFEVGDICVNANRDNK